jgi:hypothetical protein
MNTYLDHVIWACSNLEAGMRRFEALTGVQPEFGGVHASGLTHNALVGLGGKCYLEILAPVGAPTSRDDPWCQFAHASTQPRFMTYCMRSPVPLAELAAAARSAGAGAATVAANGRKTPAGTQLRWQWTAPQFAQFGHAFPFFIDWLDSPHPGETLGAEPPARTLRLRRFAVGHPDADGLRALLGRLRVAVDVFAADAVRFDVDLETPAGPVSP